MEARLLGPVRSPGRAVYERELRASRGRQRATSSLPLESSLLRGIRTIFPAYNSSSELKPAFHSRNYSLPGPYGKDDKPYETQDQVDNQVDEELAWYGSRVIWSRGASIIRTLSFHQEKQKVTHAMFAWFHVEADSSARAAERQTRPSTQDSHNDQDELRTFGPFHTSQYAKWGQPSRRRIREHSRKHPLHQQNGLKRCLVVFLEEWAHVYYPTGHDIIFNLPFPIDIAWPIPSGGIIFQNAVERSVLCGLPVDRNRSREMTQQPNMEEGFKEAGLLDSLPPDMDVSRSQKKSQCQLYTLMHPSSEPQAVCCSPSIQGGLTDECGDAIRVTQTPNQLEPMGTQMKLIWMSESEDMPIAVFQHEMQKEIVFTRWAIMPLRSRTQVMDPLAEQELSAVEEDTRDVDGDLQQAMIIDSDVIQSGAHSETTSRTNTAEDAFRESEVVSKTGVRRKSAQAVGPRRSISDNKRSAASRRRISFNPESVNPTAGELAGAGLAPSSHQDSFSAGGGLNGEERTSTRIRAEGDMVRSSIPPKRRISQGLLRAEAAGERKKRKSLAGHGIGEVDVGETTMLHGLNQERELELSPDLVFTEIMRWQIPPERYAVRPLVLKQESLADFWRRCPSSCHEDSGLEVEPFASDELCSESLHINIFLKHRRRDSSRLHIFRISRDMQSQKGFDIQSVLSRSAASAVPAICTRPHIHDVVFCDVKGKVYIISNGQIEDIDSRSLKTDKPPPEEIDWSNFRCAGGRNDDEERLPDIVSLEGRAGGRIVVHLSNDSSMWADINFNSKNVMVNQLLRVLSFVLPPKNMAELKFNVLRDARSACPCRGTPLQAAGQVLIILLGFEYEDSHISSRHKPNSRWGLLLHQAQYDYNTDIRMSLPSPPIPRQSCPNRLEDQGKLGAKAILPCLRALHLLGQEYLLRNDRKELLVDLASLIITISLGTKMRFYSDYWMRQVPAAKCLPFRYSKSKCASVSTRRSIRTQSC